jgi:hypothetical protein
VLGWDDVGGSLVLVEVGLVAGPDVASTFAIAFLVAISCLFLKSM